MDLHLIIIFTDADVPNNLEADPEYVECAASLSLEDDLLQDAMMSVQRMRPSSHANVGLWHDWLAAHPTIKPF